MAGIEIAGEGKCKTPRGRENFLEGYVYGKKLEITVLQFVPRGPRFNQLGPKVDINEGSSYAKGAQGSCWILEWIRSTVQSNVQSMRSCTCVPTPYYTVVTSAHDWKIEKLETRRDQCRCKRAGTGQSRIRDAGPTRTLHI